MPDTPEEFTRQTIDRILKELPVKKRLEGLVPEQRLEGLSPADILQGLSAEECHALLRMLQAQGSSSNPP
jgi:hypothetical protein